MSRLQFPKFLVHQIAKTVHINWPYLTLKCYFTTHFYKKLNMNINFGKILSYILEELA